MTGFFHIPKAINEPVKDYAKGSTERTSLQAALKDARSEVRDIPMYINGKEIRTGNTIDIFPPHDTHHKIGQFHRGDASHVQDAIDSALAAKEDWETMPWEQRATIFLKAADLLAGPYRYKINSATMLAQSKNAYQAEIDASCEMIDFLRFNVQYMTDIFKDQPASAPGIWNRVEYRPLEGFVYAISPFNFTSIAGNLAACMALMGNVVVWKPSDSQVYSAKIIMDLFKDAGLPDGVVNLVFGVPSEVSEKLFASEIVRKVSFTGSVPVGKKLAGLAASGLKRCTFELGGHSPSIVCEDADLESALSTLTAFKFRNSGKFYNITFNFSNKQIENAVLNLCKKNKIKDGILVII